MIQQFFERFRKWAAIRSYRANLGRLLVERYGRGRRYTPAQVLATIKLYGFNERYAPYACAMFCSKQAYAEFVAQRGPGKEGVAPLDERSVPLWGGMLHDWPQHQEVVADLHDSFGDARGGDLVSDGDHSFDSAGGGHDMGGSGETGGSADGGAGGDGSH